jgi:hypothetical protein
MYEAEHDAYAESGPGCLYWGVWLAWVLVTTATFWFGESLREFVVGLFTSNAAGVPRVLSIEGRVGLGGMEPLQILPELAGGLASGAVIAVGQGLVLFPFLKLAGALEWAAATTIGRGLCWLAIYVTSQAMVRLVLDKPMPGLCVLFLLLAGIAIIAGVALGYAQGLVLRRRVAHPTWWVLANIPGYLATSILITFTLYIESQNTVRDATTLIVGAITGISTGVALLEMLRHPTHQAEWKDMFKGRTRKERARLPREELQDTVLGSSLYEPREPRSTSTAQSSESPEKSTDDREGE